MSGKVRDEVRDKLDLAFDDIGERNVKSIARPIRIFRVRPRGVVQARNRLALGCARRHRLGQRQFPRGLGQQPHRGRNRQERHHWGGGLIGACSWRADALERHSFARAPEKLAGQDFTQAATMGCPPPAGAYQAMADLSRLGAWRCLG
jgi:hypothetical protein